MRDQLEQNARQTHANPIIAENAVPQSKAKFLDADHLRQRLIALRERWPMLRQSFIWQLMPAAELRNLLLAPDARQLRKRLASTTHT